MIPSRLPSKVRLFFVVGFVAVSLAACSHRPRPKKVTWIIAGHVTTSNSFRQGQRHLFYMAADNTWCDAGQIPDSDDPWQVNVGEEYMCEWRKY